MKPLGDRLNRELARHFSGTRTTDTIGDNDQSRIRIHANRILVAGA
jgi:hypothetical protein